jgi:hypothetical protein
MTRPIIRNAAARSLTVTLAITAALVLSGCGLAETGAVAATAAASKADEAKQAKQTEARMEQKINEAYKAAADQRHAAEADSQ